jgi:SAM-dependent methyltransferase
MLAALRNSLLDPRVRALDVDDPTLLLVHQRSVEEKSLLRAAFDAFYRTMIASRQRLGTAQGREVELGSGAGFFPRVRPGLLTSDVRPGPGIDLALDATAMELHSESVAAFYAINVFHHIPRPSQFFAELERVLLPGGVCVLVEPHGGLVSKFFHTRIHTSEHFDLTQTHWDQPMATGPLSGANQALAEIVFVRDRARFATRHPSLELVESTYVDGWLAYILSGGVNFRSLVPGALLPIVRSVEWLSRPLLRHLSLHRQWVIRKRDDASLPTPVAE